MKKVILIIAFLLCGSCNYAYGQCTTQPGFVCITQAAANDMSAKLDELKADRDVIAKFMVERATNAAELAAANKVIDSWKALDVTNSTIIQKYEAVNAMYEHVIKMQSDLIDKLTNKINAPKSAWQKFLTAAKEVLILAAGITLGRGF
jgi:hypothetical protein